MAEKKHFIALDGLRGVAALAVVVLHAAAPVGMVPFPHAGLAVDFFFALSGFVVALAYEGRLTTKAMSFREFIQVRIERLHPLIILGVLFGGALYGADYVLVERGSPVVVGLAVMFGVLMIPFGSLAPDNPSSQPLNPPSWSLFGEYIANIVYGLICRHLSTLVLGTILVVGAIVEAIMIIRFGSLDIGHDFSDWPLGVLRVGFPFFGGVALYRLWAAGHLRRVRAPFVALVLGLLAVFAAPKTGWIDAAAVFIVFPLIIAAGTHDMASTPLRAVAVWAGKLSYPLYIVHYPMVWVFSVLARRLGATGFALYGLIALEIATMVVLAFVALKFYDEPVRAWLAARRRGSLPKVELADAKR